MATKPNPFAKGAEKPKGDKGKKEGAKSGKKPLPDFMKKKC